MFSDINAGAQWGSIVPTHGLLVLKLTTCWSRNMHSCLPLCQRTHVSASATHAVAEWDDSHEHDPLPLSPTGWLGIHDEKIRQDSGWFPLVQVPSGTTSRLSAAR